MTAKDFDKLEYNPLALTEGQLMQEVYNDFAKKDIFNMSLLELASEAQMIDDPEIVLDDKHTLSDILKFIVLFIDLDSPFYAYDDFRERFDGAISWSGISSKSRAKYHIEKETDWYLSLEAHYFYHVVDNAKYEEVYSKKKGLMAMNRFLRTPIEKSDNPENTVKAMLLIQQNLSKETESYLRLQAEVFPRNQVLQRRLKKQLDTLENNKDKLRGYAEIKAIQKQ